MRKLKLNTTRSIDGFVAGPSQSEQDPLGVSGMDLHRWLVELAVFRDTHGERGGEVNASTPITEGFFESVGGASIMGRNMFGGCRAMAMVSELVVTTRARKEARSRSRLSPCGWGVDRGYPMSVLADP